MKWVCNYKRGNRIRQVEAIENVKIDQKNFKVCFLIEIKINIEGDHGKSGYCRMTPKQKNNRNMINLG